MKKTIITLGSVTYAIRLKKLLLREGIKARLVKSYRPRDEVGCSHGVEIYERDLYSAIMIIRQADIPYSVERGDDDLP